MNKFFSTIADAIRSVLPARLRRFVRRQLSSAANETGFLHSPVDSVHGMALKEKFSKVYAKNIFGGAKSSFGAGSDLIQTEIIRRELPNILRRLGARTMLDASCGDWFWMREVDLNVESYIGADIVDALIERNRSQFGRPRVRFETFNLSKDQLPSADLIFCHDCLVHLSFADAFQILKNFKSSGARYLLTTTFAERSCNNDLADNFWRLLNLRLAPFYFPPPIEVINEGCTEGRSKFRDKPLRLWALQDIILT